jgi:hypothetical protein
MKQVFRVGVLSVGAGQMETEPKHQLVIIFDQAQTDISQLWTLAHKLLSDDVTKRVGLSEDGDLTLIIEGTLDAVDRDHVEISKYLVTGRIVWRCKAGLNGGPPT